MTTDLNTYDSFPRYLSAKKSVDDRALNQHVWLSLQQHLRDRQRNGKGLRVLEIGGGIGTMVERALTRGLFTHADYTLVDALAENIVTASQWLPQWAVDQGFTVRSATTSAAPTTYQISRAATAQQDAVHLSLTLQTADCFDFAAHPDQAGQYDLLIAHAFLDLVDIPRALPQLQRLLRPHALCYLTINFDGNTILQPELDPAFDQQIEALYHETMDKRLVNGAPSGDSHSGRHLFGHLRTAGIDVLDAGSSDWVLFAGKAGYPADEAYFLHFIVQTMAGALHGHPALDQARFSAWINERHAQIERGELVYIAHQLDFLGQLQA